MHGSAIRTLSEGAPPPPPPPHHLYHAPPSARPPPHSSPIHRAGVDGTVTGGSRGRGEGGTPYKKLSQAQNHRASVAAAAAAAAYMYALNPGTPGSVETRPYLPSGPPTAAVTRYPPPPPTGPSLVYSTRGDVTSGAPTYLHPPPPHPNPPQRQLPVGGDRSGVRSKYLGSMARGSSLLHPLDYVDHPRGPGPGFPPVSPYRAYHDVLPHHRSYLEREGGLATSCTGTGASGTGNESTLGGGGPAPKKIRLGMGVGALGLGLGLGVLDAKPELRQPLRVDVDSPQASSASAAGTLSQGLDRKELQYQPQVEAISPTLPGESMLDESLRSTKEDLLQRINKVDRDIAVVESQIAKTTKKQQELEEAAKRGDKDHEEETPKESKHQSIAQVIYAENRRRAQQSYEKLTKLGPSLDLPLYMQPSDVPVYQENKRTHAAFKPRLMKFLAREQEEKRERDQYLVDTYSHLMKIWLKKTEKIENSLKRKTRDAKFREHFEKVFPELKKQREDKERFSRMGARVKSDADMEEIKDFLQEKEMEERKMRQLAVIPPAVVTLKERRRHINNQNGFTEDPLAIYKERQWISVWSDAEKELFKERYLQHQKQFGIVASYLERKTVNDCVQYYYLSKKKETYKQLLRKSRARNRARAVGKPGTATGHPAQTVLDTVGGVTTRGSMQREQMAIATSSSHAQAHASAMSEVQVPRTESMAVSVSDEVHDSSRVEEKVKAEPSATQYEQISNESTSLEGEIMGKNQKARTKGHIDTDSSDDDLDYDSGKGGPHPCAVCKTDLEHFGQSRPLSASDAPQYGLREEEVGPEARVCSNCRCRCIRRRYNHCPKCPIPTCSTPKWRVKRLRHFPTKWAESTKDAQDTIIKEFQIPHGVNRCCPACFHRLSRRLGSSQTENGGLDSESGTNGIPSWTDEEIETARVSLAQNGMDWSKMSAALDARKTPLQCRKFYSANKDKPELSAAVSAFKRRQADAGLVPPPSVTDEEESGSTSSIEGSSRDQNKGSGGKGHDSSDTASASGSPRPMIKEEKQENGSDVKLETMEGIEESSCKAEGKKPTLKEEYDSSATASADEGHQMMEADDSLQKPLALSISSSISAESDAKSECVPVGEKTGATTTMMMQPKRLPDASPPPVSQSIRLKDVIEGTIDQTMTRPHSPRPPPVSSPTLSSILKPSPSSGTLFRPPGLEGLAKPQNEPPMSSAASSPGPAEDAIGEVQDLSVKKRGSPPPPRTIAKAPLVLRRPSPALPPTSEPPPAHCNSLQYSRPPESLELYPPPRNHSPRPFAPLRTPTPVPVKPIAKPALPPSAAPQLVVPSPVSKQPGKIPVRPVTGSITHGTPAVVVPPPPSPQSHKSPVGPILPMAPLSRQQRDVTGSICHGTPRSQQGQQPHPGEAKPPGGEGFYRRPSPSSAAVPVSSPYPAQYPPYPYTTQPQRPYTSDSQLSSRQIIMNDYITSQQMLSRREKESPRPESEHRERTGPAAAAAAVTMPLDPRYPIYYPGGVYVTSDGRYAQAATSTPVKENRVDWNARQGVIRGPQPYPAQIKGSESPRNAEVYQAGHERLAALVDVAVAQADRREEREREGLERGLAEYARRYHQLPAPSSTGRPPDMRQYSTHLPPGVKYHSIPPPPQPSAATPPPPDKYKLPYGGEQYERRLKQSESMDLRKVNSSPYMTGERRDLHYRMKSEEEMQRLPYPPGAYPPPHEMPRPGSKIPASGSDQLTAANLIDAIITHQINQGKSDPDRSTQEFFSKYAGKPGGPVGMPPPPRGMAPPPDHRIQSPAPRNERDPIHAREEEKARREHPSGITLQQHIDNIIQKDMTHPYYKEVPNSMMRSGLPPPPPQPSDVYAWKLQKALHNERNAAQPYAPDERQIIRIAQSSASSAGKPLYPPHSAYSPYMKAGTPYRVEPISPPLPDSNHVDVRNMPDRRPQYPAPEHPSPRPQIYDYVSNKIAEVMRTSEVSPEDKRFPMNPPGKGERRTPIPVSPHRNLIPSPARPGSRPPSDESRSSKRSLEENAGGSESEEMSRKKARPSPDPRQPDSPQSGEMVIDEGKLLSPHEDLKANSADPKMRPQYSMYRGGMPPSWYAYSALSVRPMANASSASSVGPPSSAPPPPIPPPPPPATSLGSRPREPTPIYSSQYEPLSDED